MNKEYEYSYIHQWVRQNWGKANHCEVCKRQKPKQGQKRTFCWANVSGKYTKERTDWRQLCYSCHKKFDISIKGFVAWNKGKKGLQPWHNISGIRNKTPWNKGRIFRKLKKCQYCSKKFLPKKKTNTFCSVKCSNKSRA